MRNLKKLTLLHSNDMHGACFDETPRKGRGGE